MTHLQAGHFSTQAIEDEKRIAKLEAENEALRHRSQRMCNEHKQFLPLDLCPVCADRELAALRAALVGVLDMRGHTGMLSWGCDPRTIEAFSKARAAIAKVTS